MDGRTEQIALPLPLKSGVCLPTTKVKWATSDKLSKKVALKIISKKKVPLDFRQKFLPRELDVMKMLDHPHIIKLYDILYVNDKVVYLKRGCIRRYIYDSCLL